MLKIFHTENLIEAGCDEAGRGCLAGPVVAAAVILATGFRNKLITDSKQLTESQRDKLRPLIEQHALAWAVSFVDEEIIDRINILNATILAMHRAVAMLNLKPELLLIDGNRFKPFRDIPHHCIIRGDGQFMSIAAASILAKTHRDAYMKKIGESFPRYNWARNKGYPSLQHREAIARYGITVHHRKSFRLAEQLKIGF